MLLPLPFAFETIKSAKEQPGKADDGTEGVGEGDGVIEHEAEAANDVEFRPLVCDGAIVADGDDAKASELPLKIPCRYTAENRVG